MESHWVYRRPGYRCRHGHASAKQATPGRPKNLYLREDHIIALIAVKLDPLGTHNRTDHLTINNDPGEVAEYLRANDMTIICNTDTCTLDTNPAAIPREQLKMIN